MTGRVNVGGVELSIVGDNSQFKRALKDSIRASGVSNREIQRDFTKTTASVKRLEMETRGAGRAMAGLFSGVAVGAFAVAVAKAADQFTLMRSRIALVVREGEDLLAIEKQLYDQSLRNRSNLEGTVALYSRIRQARSDLSNDEAIRITDAWSKTLLISGSSAEEAAASTMQFAQAMASGRLQGDELRSILEGNTRFAKLLSESLGITIGDLRKFGEEGKLTTDVIVAAMATGAGNLEAEFTKIPVTIGQALTNVGTAFTRYIGMQDQASGASATLAGFINSVSTNFDRLAEIVIASGAALGTGFATVAAVKAITALRAMAVQGALTTGAMGGLNAILTVIQKHPIMIGLTAITSAMAYMAVTSQDAADRLANVDEALTKFNETQEAIRADTVALKTANEKLTEAIESQGAAAQATAALEVDAINKRLAKNKELAKTYAALARADLATANRSIGIKEKNLSGDQGMLARLNTRYEGMSVDETVSAITAKQDETGSINKQEIRFLRNVAALQKLKDAAKEAEEAIKALEAPSRGAVINQEDYDMRDVYDPVTKKTGSASTAKATKADNAVKALGERELARRQIIRDLELARARDQAVRIQQLETELQIMDRMEEYMREGLSLTEAQAQAEMDIRALRQAEGQQGAIANADPFGVKTKDFENPLPETPEDMSDFEQAFKQTVSGALSDAMRTGDVEGVFKNLIFNATEDGMQKAFDALADALFSLFSEATKGMGSGGSGGLFSSLFNIVTGGGFGADPAVKGSGFGGARASGGPVSGMRSYLVGEKGPEMFVPATSGFIVPNSTRPKVDPSANGGKSINIKGGDIIVQGDASENTLRLIRQQQLEFAKQLPAAIDARVTDRQNRDAY